MFAFRMSQGLDIGRDDSEYTAPDPTEDSLVRFDEFPGLSIASKVGVHNPHCHVAVCQHLQSFSLCVGSQYWTAWWFFVAYGTTCAVARSRQDSSGTTLSYGTVLQACLHAVELP